MKKTVEIQLPKLHTKQWDFVKSPAKRKVIRAGRRGGKTVGVAILALEAFTKGNRRVLYAAPTQEQVGRFWTTIVRALTKPLQYRRLKKNESEHFIEVPGTERRIKAKTAWDANTLRGDYADLLILDEFQLMNEDTWGVVGAPMLIDNNGDAVFIYTPPSLRSRFRSKATDPQHAAKLFKKAKERQEKGSSRWAAFHFSSMDNPFVSKEALDEIIDDMSSLAYRMEILAEDVNEAPGALWKRKTIDDFRDFSPPTALDRIVVAIDPTVRRVLVTGEEEEDPGKNEAGIVVCGRRGPHGYILADKSLQASPLGWATEAVKAYNEYSADCIVAEVNQGGEMVELTIHQVDPNVPVRLVHASRSKQARAEPISTKAEKGFIHHVGHFPALEDELCLWMPGDPSPNRLDAMVWGMTELLNVEIETVGLGDLSKVSQ